MALNEQEQQLLIRRIAEIEARTGAEIVTTLVAKCDHYPEIPWKAFALGASAAALIVAALTVAKPGWSLWSPLPISTSILGAGLVAALLTVFWPAFARLFLGRERAAGEVLQYAESLFLKEQLFQTRARTGILLLVAQFERRVAIVPDRAIRARLAPEALDGVIARMTPLLAGGRTAQAFEAGLAALDELLRARGFIGGDGDNELPDRLDEDRPT
ncbi:MAG: TPM domain-containing protein [Gammaproteobacteria bacterium]|nr:TPM domain-containing protein [Gammaproteobacteria bacterium]